MTLVLSRLGLRLKRPLALLALAFEVAGVQETVAGSFEHTLTGDVRLPAPTPAP